MLLGLLVVLANHGFAQRTVTVYGTTPSQQSTSWWSSLFSGPSGATASGISKIPAGGRAVSSTPHPAVARIIVPERKSAALGSGTLIAKTTQHGYLITNWHVVREARNGALVVFANGTQAQGRILKTDKDWDLALVQIPAPAMESLPISSAVPQVGEQLWIAGYGSGEFLLQAGLCSQYLAPYPEWPLELVEVGAAARQGDSGGPILNSRGELAGVLFGQGEGYTMGAYGGRVLQFLNQVPDIDSPSRGTIAQLASTRTASSPAIANLAAPLPISSPIQVGTTLVSNSRETHPDQRYWYPERRRSTPLEESKPEYSAETSAMLARNAAPAPNHSLATKPSGPSASAESLSMYSLPKTPPLAPPVASQYSPNLDPTPNSTAARSYGLPAEAKPGSTLPYSSAPAAEHQLSFEDFAGHSLADKAITGLWCLGTIYLLFKICGWLTRSGSASPKKTAKRTVIRKPTPKAVASRVQKNDLSSYVDEDDDEDDDDEDDDDDE
jgi:hypothetical protein